MTQGQAPIDWNSFATADDDAKRRFEEHHKKDPLPDVPPALLSASDIVDYVKLTGMIFPFHNDDRHLKNASYEVSILGECLHWDADGSRCEQTLKAGEKLTLEPNSITFVQVEPTFRVPLYLALRFNLKISHVHRGILLGTGPLIDPGYRGKLLIPLHNLTTNKYIFTGGEGLIWVEFTKLSNSTGIQRGTTTFTRTSLLREFPIEEIHLTPDQSLARAAPNREIRSSMGEIVRSAKQAELHAQSAKNTLTTFGFVGIIAAAIALLSLSVGLGTLYVNLTNFVSASKSSLQNQLNEQNQRLLKLEKKSGN